MQALATLERASQTLTIFIQEGVSHNPHLDYEEEYRGLRDSAIQRFKCSVDLFWKYLQVYLIEALEITDVHGPKPVIRKSFALNLLNEQEAEDDLEMIKDRNLSSHIYVEEIAEHLTSKIPDYYTLMNEVSQRLTPSIK